VDLALFALGASRDYGERVARALGRALARHEEREFEDGEHKARPLESVRGRDAYVIHSLYGDSRHSANDKLVRLLFFLAALRDASAARVTALVPYLCYARKDRRTQPRDPLSTRYVAQLLEAAGAERVVTLDVHNPAAYENAFRIRAEHLQARRLFVDHFAPRVGEQPVAVVSPDAGGIKRAEAFRRALSRRIGREAGAAFLEKYRSGGVVTGEAVAGEVEGRVAIIVDDLVSTGGTIARAAAACARRGARAVYAAATHGLFTGDAARVLAGCGLERLVVTDTVPPFRLEPAFARDKITVLDTAGFVAEAIRRLHEGGSLSELLEA
jgi:ribose-phosphate pyrophosphokinase